MELIIRGVKIVLPDLSDSLHQAMLDLHEGFLGSRAYDPVGLTQAAKDYFDTAGDAEAHNAYFNSFTVLWQNLLANGRYEDAEAIWRLALGPAIEWETEHRGRTIHKGTPFYFWGMTAILKGNLNKGYAFMHQALEEDLRNFPSSYQTLPSFAFASIDYARTDQAFRQWLLHQAQFLDRVLAEYRRMSGRKLDLDQFRLRFLSSPALVHAVFVFAHAVSHFLALDNIPAYARRSQFAGQMMSNLMFDVLLVIDAAIVPHNPSGAKSFLKHAGFLAKHAASPITEDQLRELNAGMNADPTRTLGTILDGSYVFTGGNAIPAASIDLCVAYALRNYSAHRLAPLQLVWERYEEVRQRCLNVLFLAVEVLY